MIVAEVTNKQKNANGKQKEHQRGKKVETSSRRFQQASKWFLIATLVQHESNLAPIWPQLGAKLAWGSFRDPPLAPKRRPKWSQENMFTCILSKTHKSYTRYIQGHPKWHQDAPGNNTQTFPKTKGRSDNKQHASGTQNNKYTGVDPKHGITIGIAGNLEAVNTHKNRW